MAQSEQFINWLTNTPTALTNATNSVFGPAGTNSSVGLVPNPGGSTGLPNTFLNGKTATFTQVDYASITGTPTPAAGTGLLLSGSTFSIDASYMRGYLAGNTLSGGGSTTLTINAGIVCSDDFTTLMKLPSNYTKTFAAWAVGTGNGGLDTGAIANNTWYHVYIIERTDTLVVDVLISLSATTPTLPTNYTKQRRIGSIRTDATPNIISFVQVGDEFIWPTIFADVSGATTSTVSRTLYTLTVPTGVKVNALVKVNYVSGSGGEFIATSPDETDQAAATPAQDIHLEVVGQNGIMVRSIRTNTSAQVGGRSSVAGTISMGTYGFVDTRGRFA
jgi:hypothetical protein